MTALLHAFPGADGFARRLQRAEFDTLVGSVAAATALAESYTGVAA
jgi:p-hydroxybenzoate 3-monooxygenase